MVNILHRVGVEAAPAEIYTALTTPEGLAGWWASDTRGKGSDIGGLLQFRFVAGGFDMKVVELTPGEHVRWEVIEGPAEWIGTHIDWKITRADTYTVVLFEHEGWREPVEFMYHCSTKWATFLLSMKSLVETGKGAPDPHDVKIDDWN